MIRKDVLRKREFKKDSEEGQSGLSTERCWERRTTEGEHRAASVSQWEAAGFPSGSSCGRWWGYERQSFYFYLLGVGSQNFTYCISGFLSKIYNPLLSFSAPQCWLVIAFLHSFIAYLLQQCLRLDVVVPTCNPVIPAQERWRQNNQKVNVMLSYMVSSRPAWTKGGKRRREGKEGGVERRGKGKAKIS